MRPRVGLVQPQNGIATTTFDGDGEFTQEAWIDLKRIMSTHHVQQGSEFSTVVSCPTQVRAKGLEQVAKVGLALFN